MVRSRQRSVLAHSTLLSPPSESECLLPEQPHSLVCIKPEGRSQRPHRPRNPDRHQQQVTAYAPGYNPGSFHGSPICWTSDCCSSAVSRTAISRRERLTLWHRNHPSRACSRLTNWNRLLKLCTTTISSTAYPIEIC